MKQRPGEPENSPGRFSFLAVLSTRGYSFFGTSVVH